MAKRKEEQWVTEWGSTLNFCTPNYPGRGAGWQGSWNWLTLISGIASSVCIVPGTEMLREDTQQLFFGRMVLVVFVTNPLQVFTVWLSFDHQWPPCIWWMEAENPREPSSLKRRLGVDCWGSWILWESWSIITDGHEAKQRHPLHFCKLGVVCVQNFNPFYLYNHLFVKYLIWNLPTGKASFQSSEENRMNLRSKPGLLNVLFWTEWVHCGTPTSGHRPVWS